MSQSRSRVNRMVIELVDLKKAGLNGKIGILWSFNTDKGRWKVLVEREVSYLLVKPENLRIVADESYKSPDISMSLAHIRPKAWEVWTEPDSKFTVEQMKIRGKAEVPLVGLFHFPINIGQPDEIAERAWLRNIRGWKDPQGFNPVDGFFTDGGKDGMYLYYDNGDDTSPVNHWANLVRAVTPYYRLQQLPDFQQGGIHGNVIVMSAPHLGHQFKTYSAEQLRKWIHGLCTDKAKALSKDNTPGSEACIASMMMGAGPSTGQGFFATVSGSSKPPF